MTLDDAFFRREAGRLAAALVRKLGPARLPLVEDVVQETLASAFESWRMHGVPEHHGALLMTSAKHRAIDALRRERTAQRNAPELARTLDADWAARPALEASLLDTSVLADDELRMIFTCCTPELDDDVRVALVLHVLCGFGARELAEAFLVTRAAMEKRLSRGKKVLASAERLFELGAAESEVDVRLGAVQRALYLLFSEGYHGADAVVRRDLCRDAMRLVVLLVEHPRTCTPSTLALAALTFLGAARLPARLDDAGELCTLFEQDRSRWDASLIHEGLRLLDASATGDVLTAYHLEAGIAALHATAARAEDTRWDRIVPLYDQLLRVRPSSMAALSRAIAIAQRDGPEAGIAALERIDGSRASTTPFYAAALGELERRRGRRDEARAQFVAARARARNDAERRFLDRRIAACARTS
jgi:RNA polymerase sigma-70 factor (ECF subfamily)